MSSVEMDDLVTDTQQITRDVQGIAEELATAQELATAEEPAPQSRPLREEVADLINPWLNNDEEPPSSVSELIIFSLVLGEESMDAKEIYSWAVKTFKFYRDLAVEQYLSSVLQPDSVAAKEHFQSDMLMPPRFDGFAEAFLNFDLALEIDHDKYRVSSAAARVFLRDRLEPPRKGTFDLMGLPAELREKIYKMVLVFPPAGLTYGPDTNGTCAITLPGRHILADNSDAPRLGRSRAPGYAHLPDLPKVLAIFSVSKKVRYEALPIFYNNNTFNFEGPYSFVEALGILSKETKKEIHNLRICTDTYSTSESITHELLKDLSPKRLLLNFENSSTYSRKSVDEREEILRTIITAEIIALARRAGKVECPGNEQLNDYVLKEMSLAEELETDEEMGTDEKVGTDVEA